MPAGAKTAVAEAAPAASPHRETWRAIARTHAAISGRLEEALTAAGLPPLSWYEVLIAIAAAERQRMRMGELADAMVISRGGLTKLVDRLVNAGLLERTLCESDRRVSYASLLPAGAALLDEMRPTVEAELDAVFAAKLTAGQTAELRTALGRVQGSACGNA